ncbi:NirD/YgiW/YdeI family stress tolerance protein [Pantoea alhagi]|uniref:YgiW/YdeI family stress tolerance OB fold protein n=1 Tax=Pantoea alhagi TaxID=1891675 RepID=UPI00202B0C9C|nr:NirD/YgiW/YdeI family stress tolerance protein [Pantoea alhagi]URQ60955.1 NirD/YgiW/YdeI family stress tolerance protein [Pantoea alhagi]
MNKILTLCLATLLAAPTLAADGGFNPDGKAPPPEDQKDGYRAVTDNQQLNTAHQLAQLSTGTWVTLQGNIIRQTGKKTWELRDRTGTVQLQIDDGVWQGQEVKPDDLISVNGTLLRHGKSLLIDVKKLHLL